MSEFRRNLDKPIDDVLECVKADIALYQDGRDPDDLCDALLGIHRILEKLLRGRDEAD